MRRMLMIVIVLLTCAPVVQAADNKFAEMQKLDFLVGEWTGEAWMQMGAGKRESMVQTEKVATRLGGKVLLVEGLGKRKNDDGSIGEVVHEALAVISFDPKTKEYVFDAHVAAQESVETKLEVGDDKSAVWGLDVPGGRIRYTIRLTDKGQWNEIGEFSRDGTTWMKFFEMNLTKVK